MWIYDTEHFPATGMAVLIIADLVSRKWITEVVSVEETSTQVELAFTAALEAEGLFEGVDARHDDGRVDIGVDEESRPILLAISDNGAQMTSGSTREFMALCAIAQHFGRPGTPTDQAWIESLKGHIKIDYPHLLAIRDPATLRAELALTRDHYNGVRLSQGIPSVWCDVAFGGTRFIRASLLWGCSARGETRLRPDAGALGARLRCARLAARSGGRYVHHTSRARRPSVQASDLHECQA